MKAAKDKGISECVFCARAGSGDVVIENDLACVIEDRYPVTEGHCLVIPRRHFDDYFDITGEERDAVHELLLSMKKLLSDRDPSITGFNVGVNSGRSAGQSIFHVHIHLIPRRDHDMENPKGGVRGVIPGKMKY